jgi:hypothetical protein
MPFVYTDSLATAGNLTTNGTANTETETCFLKPGTTASTYLAAAQMGGKGGALVQLSAVVIRFLKWVTASTAGTTLASVGKIGGEPTSTITSGSRPTSGATRTNVGPIISSGASSPNQWQAINQDHMIGIRASNAGSISAMDSGAAVSMPFEFSLEHQEW